jgi:hypothetical protein
MLIDAIIANSAICAMTKQAFSSQVSSRFRAASIAIPPIVVIDSLRLGWRLA